MKSSKSATGRTALAILVIALCLNIEFCSWTRRYDPHGAKSLVGIRGFIGVSAKSYQKRFRDLTLGLAVPATLVALAGFLQSKD